MPRSREILNGHEETVGREIEESGLDEVARQMAVSPEAVYAPMLTAAAYALVEISESLAEISALLNPDLP